MATPNERAPATTGAARDVAELFAPASRRVVVGPGDVRELQLVLDEPPLRARSRLLTCGRLLFVQGDNEAQEEMLLRHEGTAPMVAVHAPLRGSAVAYMDGLGASLVERPGEVQLFASPSSHATVRLRAHVKNQAFRVVIPGSLITTLAAQRPELEALADHVESGRSFRGPPVASRPLPRLRDDMSEIMNSDHYGGLRPLFLESRALGWLALALATPRPEHGEKPRRADLERMHAARELLLSRLANPPTLAEVASAVGTNEFALKRQFKAVFGQPVYAYLLAVRLAQACRLLKDSAHSVKEIAAAVGYTHANHFSTAFRRAYGVTPAEFRAPSRH